MVVVVGGGERTSSGKQQQQQRHWIRRRQHESGPPSIPSLPDTGVLFSPVFTNDATDPKQQPLHPQPFLRSMLSPSAKPYQLLSHPTRTQLLGTTDPASCGNEKPETVAVDRLCDTDRLLEFSEIVFSHHHPTNATPAVSSLGGVSYIRPSPFTPYSSAKTTTTAAEDLESNILQDIQACQSLTELIRTDAHLQNYPVLRQAIAERKDVLLWQQQLVAENTTTTSSSYHTAAPTSLVYEEEPSSLFLSCCSVEDEAERAAKTSSPTLQFLGHENRVQDVLQFAASSGARSDHAHPNTTDDSSTKEIDQALQSIDAMRLKTTSLIQRVEQRDDSVSNKSARQKFSSPPTADGATAQLHRSSIVVPQPMEDPPVMASQKNAEVPHDDAIPHTQQQISHDAMPSTTEEEEIAEVMQFVDSLRRAEDSSRSTSDSQRHSNPPAADSLVHPDQEIADAVRLADALRSENRRLQQQFLQAEHLRTAALEQHRATETKLVQELEQWNVSYQAVCRQRGTEHSEALRVQQSLQRDVQSARASVAQAQQERRSLLRRLDAMVATDDGDEENRNPALPGPSLQNQEQIVQKVSTAISDLKATIARLDDQLGQSQRDRNQAMNAKNEAERCCETWQQNLEMLKVENQHLLQELQMLQKESENAEREMQEILNRKQQAWEQKEQQYIAQIRSLRSKLMDKQNMVPMSLYRKVAALARETKSSARAPPAALHTRPHGTRGIPPRDKNIGFRQQHRYATKPLAPSLRKNRTSSGATVEPSRTFAPRALSLPPNVIGPSHERPSPIERNDETLPLPASSHGQTTPNKNSPFPNPAIAVETRDAENQPPLDDTSVALSGVPLPRLPSTRASKVTFSTTVVSGPENEAENQINFQPAPREAKPNHSRLLSRVSKVRAAGGRRGLQNKIRKMRAPLGALSKRLQQN